MKKCIGPASCVLLLALIPSAGAAQSGQSIKKAEPLSTGCFSTHTAGSGPKYIKICISTHGNLSRFETAGNRIYINGGEGYVVCANSGSTLYSAHDAGIAESNWGNPVITQPKGANTFPLTITRKTANNWLELAQTYALDAAEYDVTITMTLKNISGKTLTDVEISRYADWDIFPGSDDDHTFTSDSSVFAWTHSLGYVPIMSLSSASTEQPRSYYETYTEWLADLKYCSAGHIPGAPPIEDDYVGRISRFFGTMAIGATKQIKVVYRRF